MISRNVAIALGIICVFLIACIGGAIAYYTMQINNKDNTIASLNSELANLQGNLTDFQGLNDLMVLKNTTVTTQDEEFGWDFDFQYSGYILVSVTSTSYNTSVTVGWYNYDYQYLDQRPIFYGYTQLFPIVASPDNWITAGVTINFGASANVTNTATVTITYYY